MALAVPRTLLDALQLANPLYSGARVYAYEADPATWKITARLAPLYDAPSGVGKISNPTALDADGKWQRPVYVDRPVILRITSASVPSHDTGVLGMQSSFRGDWAVGVTYLAGQIVRDGAAGADTGNLYACIAPHTAAGEWSAALAQGLWTLYLEAGSGTGGDAERDYITPEDFGAIGDGTSRPAGTYLALGSLAALQAYSNGIYSFADSLTNEMDWLGCQAALYAGGEVRGRPGASYICNKILINPNGYAHVDWRHSKLIFSEQAEIPDDGSNLLVNGDLEAGITGWENTALDGAKPFVFTGGKAVFTDPTTTEVFEGTSNSFGAIGQQVTIPAGRWTCKMKVKLSDGATHGYFGPPYAIMRFTPYGIGFGSYEYPNPLTAGATAGPEFDGWLSVDLELAEAATTWFMIQGGNCNWEVQEARISRWLPNFAVWMNGDFDMPGKLKFDDSTWKNVMIYGPATQWQDGYAGPVVDGILHKSFLRDTRCNLENVHIRRFRRGEVVGDNAYLMVHRAVTIGYCAECIYYQNGAKNSGEQLRYESVILFNSGLAINAEGGAEWNFTNSSFDYCRRLVSARKGALMNFTNQHFELNPGETRIYLATVGTAFVEGGTLTGATSGATAKILKYRAGDDAHLVIRVLSGTFQAGEALTGNRGGAGTAAGAVQYADYLFDLRGGSILTIPSGEFLKAGFEDQGALYDAYLETNLDQIVFGAVWGYNWVTATGDWATGAGRIAFGRHLGPGNALLPDMFLRNGQMDAFGNNGGIRGSGTGIWEDQEILSPVPANIGIDFAARSDEASGAPIHRGLIPWEQLVSGVTDVHRTTNRGAMKLEYNPAYSGNVELHILVPVTSGKFVLSEFYYAKPDAKPPVSYGPFTSGSPDPGDTIRVNTQATQSLVTIEDKHISDEGLIPFPSVQSGWTVTFSNVTGNPGGIADAVWNGTHTVVERLRADNRYTIDLGTPAATTAVNAGGTGIQATYSQTNVNIFIRIYWMQVINRDSVGRPEIGGRQYAGERQILLDFASQSWTRWKIGTWYSDAGIKLTPGDPRMANGRAPDWATHFAIVINWKNIRLMDEADPPPLYLTDFYANVL